MKNNSAIRPLERKRIGCSFIVVLVAFGIALMSSTPMAAQGCQPIIDAMNKMSITFGDVRSTALTICSASMLRRLHDGCKGATAISDNSLSVLVQIGGWNVSAS